MAAKKLTVPNEPKFYTREHPELSERISIAEFKKQCDTLYRQYEVMVPKEEDLAMQLQVSTDIYHEVESVCNVEQLKPTEGLVALKNKGVEGLPRDHNLQVIKNFQLTKDIITRKDEPSNYAPRRVTDSHTGAEYISQPVQQPEVVLTVAIHHPFRQKKKDMEFQVLGSQPLTVLKDVISCQSDYLIYDDCSENPSEDVQKYVFELGKGRKDHSGFFFIDNTFYNDMRNPVNEDYSKTIVDWASAPERINSPRLDQFESVDMALVHFDQLIIRLGYPYLYCHQGNCEHLMMFTDVSMLHPDDCQDIKMYPLLVFQARARRRVCGICAIYTATWVTRHDELAAEDPAFYCDSCFKMLHYTEDGLKLCNFKAYPYYDHVEQVVAHNT
ncbi:snRNA-activating protein complex subunit 3-like [Dysidea avara]|uniref:snRNA-activating protein complex subunit 3-like n=1 Tax=Dysidea avara TaxID=196820 RepID=UPI00332B4230